MGTCNNKVKNSIRKAASIQKNHNGGITIARLESEIEAYLFGQVKRLKGECIKIIDGQGLPDRLIVLPKGVVFFVELKREDKGSKLSALQKERIRRLRALGVRVHTPRNKNSIDKILYQELNSDKPETITDAE